MRIAYLSAGAGPGYCGACAYDVGAVLGLRALGHEVALLPLYTPLRTEVPDPGLPRVFYGGISAYLQQHLALFRVPLGPLDWLLDRPALLRFVARRSVSTRPEDLGEMTVSVLRGREGRQRKELRRLLRYLRREVRPDLVVLTNTMLSGLVPALREELGAGIVAVLQGEEAFLQRLPEPCQGQAWECIREHSRGIHRFIAPSRSYGEEMASLLGVEADRIRVVRPGIDAATYQRGAPATAHPFRIGYLSRLAPEKGIDLLAQAFVGLEQERSGQHLLAVAGQALGPDQAHWREVRAELEAAGLWHRVEFAGEVDLAGKVDHLRRASVICLPTRLAERRGVVALEALAAGTPVVAPDRGVFGELAELTGGVVLVPPDDREALAEALGTLQGQPERVRSLGVQGRDGVREHFSLAAMAERTLGVYEEVLATAAT